MLYYIVFSYYLIVVSYNTFYVLFNRNITMKATKALKLKV